MRLSSWTSPRRDRREQLKNSMFVCLSGSNVKDPVVAGARRAMANSKQN